MEDKQNKGISTKGLLAGIAASLGTFLVCYAIGYRNDSLMLGIFPIAVGMTMYGLVSRPNDRSDNSG